jgi:succinyl-diaminopimelate desuccinylase
MENSKSLKLFSKISELEKEAVKFMTDLISLNSVGPKNDGPGEAEKANFIIKYIDKIGCKEIKNYSATDTSVAGGERPNLVMTIPGKNPDKTLWIMSHMDVVPAGDLSKWKTDPFKAKVENDKIFGRGSEDNLQGLVSSIIAGRAFLETGIQPEFNFGLVFVSDEETGSDFGLTFLMETQQDIFKPNDLIIVPDAGEPDGSLIEVAEKSILWLKFKTVGIQVHASIPNLGINAFKAASNLVVKLENLHKIYDASDELFSPPISTFEPTKKESNVPNINTLPGEDTFYMDCRILPKYSVTEVLQTVRTLANDIEEKFNVKIEVSTDQNEQAAPMTPVDSPVVSILLRAVKQVYGVEAKAEGIGGGTVAAIFRRNGIPAAVWSTLDDLAHQPNEYCKISNMMNDAKVFALCALG